ncbi:hypothetical protein HDU86_005448 [Geranomyces michiganensis]|nr:hypothetical protein HDU86_005448 [Geranomyces michiganensis]
MSTRYETLAPYPPGTSPLRGSMKETFAYSTVKERLPVILTKCVDSLSRELHASTLAAPSSAADKEKAAEAKHIIAEISKLVYELQRDRPLQPLTDSDEDVGIWNATLASLASTGPATWYQLPWLFIECYLYRKIHELFILTVHWKDYDIFAAQQKETSFWGSVKSMEELAKHLRDVQARNLNDEEQKTVLREFVHFCLWGNQTDLSLLQDVAHADMHKMQQTSAAGLKQLEEKVIVNHSQALLEEIEGIKGGRVDFIMDNAGFELYSDLILADWLVHSGVAKLVVFHAKRIGWFVSDTTARDFHWTLDAIQKHAKAIGDENLNARIERWRGFLATGTWRLHVDPFWTLPYPFWQLPTAGAELYNDICKSQLLIFKGDLNYRKCVYDLNWKATTSVEDALGGLCDPRTPPLVLLRTCKSDPAVGLRSGQAEELDTTDPKWRVNGKWGMLQFRPKTSE